MEIGAVQEWPVIMRIRMGTQSSRTSSRHGFSRSRGLAILCAVPVVLMAGAALAEVDRGSRVVVLPAMGDGVSAAVLDSVDVALESLALLVSGVDAVADEELRETLGRDPRAALVACGEDRACIADLGRQVGCHEVLLVRVSPVGGGYELGLSVIGVSDRAVRRSLTVPFAGSRSLEATLQGREAEVFVGGSTELSASSGASPTDAGANVWQGAALGSPIRPPLERPAEVQPKPIESVAESVEQPPAVAAARGVEPAQSTVESHAFRPYLIASVGAAAVALVASGVGSYFGLRYRSAREAIDADGPKTTSLSEVVRLERRANEARPGAIAGFVVAGVTALAAVGLFVWDRRAVDSAAASVSVTPKGATLVVAW